MTIYEDMTYEEMLIFKKPIHYYSKAEIEQASKEIVLRHFTTSFLSRRPWRMESNVPHVDVFKSYYDGEYKEIEESLFLKIFKLIPRKMAFYLIGIIQAKIRPKLYRLLK